MADIPAEFQSKAPARLRDLAREQARPLSPAERQVVFDAAAEIEGSEEAYAVLVSEVGDLRGKLRDTRRNLDSAYEFIGRWRELLVALQVEHPNDIRVRRALAGEHPMRPAPWERKA